MGYIVMYLSSLATALFLCMAGFSFADKVKKRWLSRAVSSLWFSLLMAPALLMSIIAFFLFTEKIKPDWLLAYALSWIILFTIGAGLIERRFKRARESATPSIRPLGKIIEGIVLSGAICLVTVYIMDSGAKEELRTMQKDASAIINSLNHGSIPEKDNAAGLYEEAAKFFTGANLPEWYSKSDDPGFDPSAPEVQTFLKDKKEILSLLAKAAGKKGYYVPIVEQKSDLPIPQGLNAASRLLILDARLSIKKGEIHQAMGHCSTLYEMAEHTRGIPNVYGALLSGALETRSGKTFEYLFPYLSKIKMQFGPRFISGMEMRRKYAYLNMLRGENAYILQALSSAALSGNLSAFREYFGEQSAVMKLFSRPLAAFYRIFLMQPDIAYVRSFFYQAPAFFEKPYFEARAFADAFRNSYQAGDRGGLLTAMLVPAMTYSSAAGKFAKTEAYSYASQIAMAAYMYHGKFRKYPDRLEALVRNNYMDKAPIDPFDGKPMKLMKQGDGIVIYSVGENGKDDGGKEDDLMFKISKVYRFTGSTTPPLAAG